MLNCVATVTDYAIFGGPTSKNIPLEAPSPHAKFESSRSNSNEDSKFDPKFDLSDMVHSLAISNKPTGLTQNSGLFPLIVVLST